MEIVSKPLRKLILSKGCSRISEVPFKCFYWRSSGEKRDIFRCHLKRAVDKRTSQHHGYFSSPFCTVSEKQVDPNALKKSTFVYTDYSKIEDEKKQGCYLSKSVLKPGLPPIYDRPLNLDEARLEEIYKEFESHLIDSFLFCYGEEELNRKKYSVVNAFLNMTQTIWRKTTSCYNTNLSRSLFYKQHVSASFNRCDEYDIHIGGKPKKSFLMMSKDPLKQFATKEEVLKSSEDIVEWDEVFNPVLNFRQAEIDNISKPPFSAGSPYPHPHTLFITADKKNVEMKRLIGHAILYTFAHAYTHALSMPQNAPGMKEIEPVTAQCVVSDGRILSFICHQLNTLDFQNDNGIKNFTWVDDNLEMFKYAYLKIPGDKRYKDITETTIYLEDVNYMAFEKFLKFILI